ncbi:Embryogenesis-associated protein EMB8 [Acorus gramineus]|uniref:Embryogenesis-associated protein EMB8 n=1 Tax=Acorus gramineus TaxID=55184 RepID=A0AAV9A2R8_ACOGR|nr:Embryogenesis-associated protein EMB8 [Acorus gramineus]
MTRSTASTVIPPEIFRSSVKSVVPSPFFRTWPRLVSLAHEPFMPMKIEFFPSPLMADCTNPKSIVGLLIEAATLIPTSQYLLGLVLFVLIFLYNFLEFHLFRDLLKGFRGDQVTLTFNPRSHIYEGVASKCRIFHGRYLATPWLSNPHFQTAFLNFFGRPPVFNYKRQVFQIPDGGTIALDWLMASDIGRGAFGHDISEDDLAPIVVVIPGLMSDSSSAYIKHLVFKIAKRGWNVVVSNHRGLGGISLTSDCFYNAGWTEDVRRVINYLHQEHPKSPLFAVGTSIGANILVKYLGENREETPIAGAASICSPWDLVVCDRFITRRLIQRFYDRALTIGLQGYAQIHQTVYSRLADWEGIKKSRSVRDFDNYATCLVEKFETVDTYYRHCSSASYVGNVAVPLLCISALDDPVCTKEAIPWDECRANRNIILATTRHGGHLGFFEGILGDRLWYITLFPSQYCVCFCIFSCLVT